MLCRSSTVLFSKLGCSGYDAVQKSTADVNRRQYKDRNRDAALCHQLNDNRRYNRYYIAQRKVDCQRRDFIYIPAQRRDGKEAIGSHRAAKAIEHTQQRGRSQHHHHEGRHAQYQQTQSSNHQCQHDAQAVAHTLA